MLRYPDSLSWIDPVEDRIIAATGAGGKTSCLEYLALALKQLGHKVLLTTTTKIFRPSATGFGQHVDRLIEQDVLVRAACEPEPSTITVAGFPEAGHPDQKPEKLSGLDIEAIQHLASLDIYDNILIEADGSRQLPLKAPSITEPNEPVLPNSCQVIIGVTGWTGIGQPVNPQHIHRWEQFSALTGLSAGDRVSPEAIDQLLRAPHGLFRYAPADARKVWLLNQVDDFSDRMNASEFIHSVQLLAPPVHHYVISNFQNPSEPFVQEVIRDHEPD